MDIYEKAHARSLDLLGISDNVIFIAIRFGIVTATACSIAILRLGRDKRTQTNRIESVIFQNRKDIAFGTIDIKEFCIFSFVFLHLRDVGTIEEI